MGKPEPKKGINMATRDKALRNLRVSEESDGTSNEILPVCHECECKCGSARTLRLPKL